jgi:hypothetical protein
MLISLHLPGARCVSARHVITVVSLLTRHSDTNYEEGSVAVNKQETLLLLTKPGRDLRRKNEGEGRGKIGITLTKGLKGKWQEGKVVPVLN